jgi:hypothetical protein
VTVNIKGFKFLVTMSICHAKFKFLSIVLSSNSINDETFCPTTLPILINSPFTLLYAVAYMKFSSCLKKKSTLPLTFELWQEIPEYGSNAKDLKLKIQMVKIKVMIRDI